MNSINIVNSNHWLSKVFVGQVIKYRLKWLTKDNKLKVVSLLERNSLGLNIYRIHTITNQ